MRPDPLDDLPPTATRSSGAKSAAPVDLSRTVGRPVKDILRGLVYAGGELAHHGLARTQAEQDAEVWLMKNEQQAAGIADPLANMVGRRTGGPVINPDMADLIMAGLATLGYLAGNVIKMFEIRRTLRRNVFVQQPQENP